MKPRTIVTVVILAFVAVSVAYLVVKELRPDKPEAAEEEGAGADAGAGSIAVAAGGADSAEPEAVNAVRPTPAPRHVRVAYFYFGKRCAKCLKLEKYSREAVERGFPDELAAGTVVWEAIDTDEPTNRHYNKDYDLFAKAVIVSEIRDGEEVRWKNLMDVWQLTGDRGAFHKYVQDEVREFMEGE